MPTYHATLTYQLAGYVLHPLDPVADWIEREESCARLRRMDVGIEASTPLPALLQFHAASVAEFQSGRNEAAR